MKQQHRTHQRKSQGDTDRHPTAAPGTRQVAGADVESHPDRHGHAQRHRHHESQPSHIEGDLMGGHGIYSQASDEQRHHREHRELEEYRETNRATELHQASDLSEVGARKAAEQPSDPHARAAHHQRQNNELQPHHQGTGPAAAHAAHGRHEAAAVDEKVVERDLDQQA
jgi:hypothetical protein